MIKERTKNHTIQPLYLKHTWYNKESLYSISRTALKNSESQDSKNTSETYLIKLVIWVKQTIIIRV
ncbi:hypothetical protein Hanom_Chr11g01002711 [Helianthus anomalus]